MDNRLSVPAGAPDPGDLPIRAALASESRALDGLVSYDGRVFFGMAGDRDVVADLDDFAAALGAAMREQPVPRRKAAVKPKATSGR